MWTTKQVMRSTLVKEVLVITMLMSPAAAVIARQPHHDSNSIQSLSRSPAPYSFAYGVASEPESVRYGHREESNGNTVRGAYSIALPDGRTQTVEYEADPIRGYNAKVTYEATPGYIRPPTSTQDSLATGTTQYSHLPIVQMERSARTLKPTQPRTQQPQMQRTLKTPTQSRTQQPQMQRTLKSPTLPRTKQPKIQLAQSSQPVATNRVLPYEILRRVVAKVLSTTTLEPRHVTAHQRVITKYPNLAKSTSATKQSMFSLPWNKLLRVPLLKTIEASVKDKSSNPLVNIVNVMR